VPAAAVILSSSDAYLVRLGAIEHQAPCDGTICRTG